MPEMIKMIKIWAYPPRENARVKVRVVVEDGRVREVWASEQIHLELFNVEDELALVCDECERDNCCGCVIPMPWETEA